MKRVTIKYIAAEAGVSKATVSRVLNHQEIVDEETKKLVLAVMEKHRYSPSLVARNLSNRKSNTIGVIIPEIDNPFYGKLLRTIISTADDCDLIPICFDTGNSGEKDVKALKIMHEQRVGGLIYAPSVEYAHPKVERQAKQVLADMQIPVVLLDRNIPSFGVSGVFYNNIEATFKATLTLLAAGHTRIAIIGGNHRIGIARERLAGYLQAMEHKAIPIEPNYIFEGDFTTETAYTLAKQMLALPQRPTAVVTCNNCTGLGFLQAVTETALRCPQDIAHIGVDEIDAFEYLHIPYSHVTRSTKRMGETAMQLLLQQLETPDKKVDSVIIQPQYVLEEPLFTIALQNKIILPEQKGEVV